MTSMTRERYDRVNGTWPEHLPRPTGPEAITAFRRLYRHWMGRRWPGKVALTSGNRNTWPRRGTFYVNPESWRGLVHDLSHYAHRRLNPKAKPHDPRHAAIEREMIEYVVTNGWLDGKLKRPEKPKGDVKAVRAARVDARLKTWQAKLKRAQTAIKKLRRQQAYYQRTLAA